MENTTTDLDSPQDSFKLEVESVRQLWEEDNTPKIKSKLNGSKSRIVVEPLRIKIKHKRANLNKIKLKFKRNAEDFKRVENVQKSSKQLCYSTQPMESEIIKNMKEVNHQEMDEEDSIFRLSNYLSTPRKTAYFGK